MGRLLAHDPVVAKDELAAAGFEPAELPPVTPGVDAVVILNNHLTYQRLNVLELVRGMAERPVVVDTWHVLRPDEVIAARPCIYVGLGWHRSSIEPLAIA